MLCTIACKTSNQIIETENDLQVTKIEEDEDTLFASISRTSCFGHCPVYELNIYSSGYMIYVGKNFVDRMGTYNARIDSIAMQEFIDTALAIGYMSMEDKYDSPVSDLPAAITSIKINGVRKEIYRRHQYPREIIHFEQLFDRLVISADWKLVPGSESNER